MLDYEVLKFEDFEADKTIVIIIYMYNGFAKAGNLYSPRVEKLIDPIVNLAEKAISSSISVLAYTDYHSEDAKEFSAYPAHCIANTVESELVDSLKALISVGLIVKHKNSTNGLLAYNPAQSMIGIAHYIVVGCVTDICVYQYATTLRAYLNEHNLEGEVIVSKAHMDTYDIPDVHDGDLFQQMAITSMAMNGIKVVNDIILQ
ncbi:MAG: isochorismatase family protein [Vallitaleaceae bacterium]|jgi:nicotinamidase-related amidase|nr:isochorismatase family protein [Vallitaleaceae bacterium]